MERARGAAPPVEFGVDGFDPEVLGADEVAEDVVLLGHVSRDGAWELADAEENACAAGGEALVRVVAELVAGEATSEARMAYAQTMPRCERGTGFTPLDTSLRAVK